MLGPRLRGFLSSSPTRTTFSVFALDEAYCVVAKAFLIVRLILKVRLVPPQGRGASMSFHLGSSGRTPDTRPTMQRFPRAISKGATGVRCGHQATVRLAASVHAGILRTREMAEKASANASPVCVHGKGWKQTMAPPPSHGVNVNEQRRWRGSAQPP